jgi:GntR family transcriptional repressor for pyruvate dehydrogenase complex
MEGLAAERAATYGTDADLQVIDELYQKMTAVHGKRNPKEEAQLDADFHLAIIEASHNVIMLHMMRSMYQLLREGVFYNRQIMFKQRTTREALLDQHKAINEALQAREPQQARAAVEQHLTYVEEALFRDRKLQRNEAIALQRLQRERDRG